VGERLYSVYIMASRTGVLYTGITSDLPHRVYEHKTGIYDGFTKKYKCHRLVYYEQYDSVYAAIGREKQLKAWTRAKKIALIESVNPRWSDLGESWGSEFLVRGQSMKNADEARARRIKLQIDSSSPKSHADGD
jgi:putative endonuclease